DDQYVVEIDETEEARESYESTTTTRYRDTEGNLHDAYDVRFYRDLTDEEAAAVGPIAGTGSPNGMTWTSQDWGDGRGYRPKIHFVPDGWEEVEVPRSETESFADFVESYYGRESVACGEQPQLSGAHKYGYSLLDEHGNVTKVVKRTNPNDKWDWY